MAGFYGGFVGNEAGMASSLPLNFIAGGPSFEINKRPGSLGGRTGEQLRRLYQEGGVQQNQQLNEELRQRGILPGGPQLPLAGFPGAAGNMAGMANAEFFAGPQLSQLPAGFLNKTIIS